MSGPEQDTEQNNGPAAGQVFRVVESSDEQPDNATESKAEEPARRSRGPLAVLVPLGLTAVLGIVGLVQGGLGWWAAAAGAGVVGTPVAVAVARRAAKRRAQRDPFGLTSKGRSGSPFGSGRSGRSGGSGRFGRRGSGRSGLGHGGAGRGGSRLGTGGGSRGSRFGKGRGSRAGSRVADRGPHGPGALGRLFGRGRSASAKRAGSAGGAGRGGRSGGGRGGAFGRSRRGRGASGDRAGARGATSPQSRRERRQQARQAKQGRQAMRRLKRFMRQQPGGSGTGTRTTQRGRWPMRAMRWLSGRRRRDGSSGPGAGPQHADRGSRANRRPWWSRLAARFARTSKSGGPAGPDVDPAVADRDPATARTTMNRRQRFARGFRAFTGALGFGVGKTGRFGYLGIRATGRGLAGAARWGAGRIHEWATTGPASWFRLATGWATRRWAGAHQNTATAGPTFGDPPQMGGSAVTPRPGPTPRPAGPGSAPVAPAAPLAPVVSIVSGGSAMSHPVNDAASEAGSAVGSYEPRNMIDIRSFTQSTPDQLTSMADGYTAVGERLSETPAGGGVAESYSQIGAHLRALASNSGEIAGQLAAYNSDDFERIDNPRPNEHMADYGQNQAG